NRFGARHVSVGNYFVPGNSNGEQRELPLTVMAAETAILHSLPHSSGGAADFLFRGAAALRARFGGGTTLPFTSGPAAFFVPFFTRGERAVGCPGTTGCFSSSGCSSSGICSGSGSAGGWNS